MSRYRFPGLRSFEENDAAIFNGRSKETQQLFDLIMVERVVVMFAKSGAGKTSLLRAGIVPMLANLPYEPVFIRLNHRETPLQEQVFGQIAQVFGISARPGQTLWEYLRDINTQTGNITPVLFFDQFEEVFTLYEDKKAEREALFVQLADLINAALPVAVRRRLLEQRDQFPAGQLVSLEKPPAVKAVFAIRSDQLSRLHELSDRIPGILRNRYELKGLRREQAAEAILKPAALPDTRFNCAPFTVEPEALNNILDHLGASAAGTPEGAAEIESFQLQLICSHLEMKMLERQNQGANLLKVNVGTYGGKSGLEQLLAGFYQDTIGQIPDPTQQYNARRFIEDTLILNERRVIMPEAAATGGEHPLHPEVLHLLVDKRLLRREAHPGTGNYYELVHDTLLKPVLQFKRERELREAAEKARMERDAEARKRRKVAIYAGIVGLLAIVAFIALIYAMQQEKKTRFSFLYTAAQLQAGQNPTLAFRLGEQALKIKPENTEAQGMLVHAFYGSPYAVGDTLYATPHFRAFEAVWAKPSGSQNVLLLHPDMRSLLILNPDSASGQTLNIREGAPVVDAALSPDGRWLVSTHRQDSLARLWRVADGSLTGVLVHQGPVLSVVWSPDGRFFTTNAADDSQRLWDATGRPVARYENKATADLLPGCAFSPDAGQLAVLKNDSTLCLYDLPTAQESACFIQPNGQFVQAAYASNSRYLAVAGLDFMSGTSSVTLLDRRGNRLFTHTTDRPSQAILRALPDQDGRRVLVGRKDSLAGWLYGQQDSFTRLGTTFDQHRGILSHLAMSGDSAYLLTVGLDKTAKVWNRYGQLLFSLPQRQKVEQAFFSGDSRYVILTTSDGRVRLWGLKKNPLAQLPVSGVSQVFFDPASGHIAALDREHRWGYWDVSGSLLPAPGWMSDTLTDAKPWGDGSMLLARPPQNAYELWDLRSGRRQSLPGEKGRVVAVAARATIFARMQADTAVEIWQIAGDKRLALLSASGKKAEQAALSPEGRYAAVSYRRRSDAPGDAPLYEVRITDLQTGQSDLVTSGEKPFAIDFSPSGDVLRLSRADEPFEWPVKKRALRPLAGQRPGSVSAIVAIVHSPDGRWIATSAEDRTVSLWSCEGQWLHTFSCGRSRTNFVRFSADGRYLLFEYHWPGGKKQALIVPLDAELLRPAFDRNLFYPLFPNDRNSSVINQ